jgi:hypothetical protein
LVTATNLFKQLLKLTGLGSLAFSVACGGGSGGNFPPPVGGFSNASLSGQFAYQMSGLTLPNGTPFRESGVFTSDGAGRLTAITDDFALGSSVTTDPGTGTYSISSDGTGTAVFNFSSGSLSLALTLVSATKFYIVEGDNFATTFGVGQKQDSSTFSNIPGGTFVFREHTLSTSQGSTSTVGVFTTTNGTLAGTIDRNRAGVLSSSNITGLLNFPDSTNGRGSGTFTDSNNSSSSFLYYVVDANHIQIFSTDAGIIGIGQAEKQTGAPFSSASLSGGYAFQTRGDTGNNIAGLNTVGRFTADGTGNITDGALDSVEDGASSANIAFTGTYTMSAPGRAAVATNPSTGAEQQVFWMVSPARAFSLTNSANVVEDGTVDMQTGTFSNSTLNGQYAFVMDGIDSGTKDRVGTFLWNGNGGVTVREFANASGITSTSTLSGNYSVSANGRALTQVNSLSNNLVFYLISGNDAYILQNDPGVEIEGVMSKQAQ